MSTIKDQAIKVLGALATALGTTGAFVVIGAAFLWVRFSEVDLPAVQAVTVQPRQEMLVQGAQLTVVFALIALGAVLLMLFANLGRPESINLRSIGILTLLMIGAIVYVWTTKLDVWPKLGLSALAVVLALGCWGVGRNTSQGFWALGLSVFVSSILFSSASGLLIADQQKYVQGVAVLRGDEDTGLSGIFVAAADETIYLGKPSKSDEAREKMSMFEVPRGEKVSYAVGPLEPQAEAEERAETMLAQLIDNRSRNGGGTGAPVSEQEEEPDPAVQVASAFRRRIVVVRTTVKAPLCLVRYTNSKAEPLGRWWTSCAEARRLKTINKVRQRLALPRRFQATYNMRVRGVIRAGTKSTVLVGRAAPRCERVAPKPCGRRYSGGGRQYYVDPRFVHVRSTVCTKMGESRPLSWKKCKQ